MVARGRIGEVEHAPELDGQRHDVEGSPFEGAFVFLFQLGPAHLWALAAVQRSKFERRVITATDEQAAFQRECAISIRLRHDAVERRPKPSWADAAKVVWSDRPGQRLERSPSGGL